MDYLTLKYLHILSSTLLFGTGLGSAFYLFMANRHRHISGIVFTTHHVVLADWLFTTPSVLIQLITGIALVHLGGYDFSDQWISLGLALYFFAGACWLPVVWLQIKMRNMATDAQDNNKDLPERYWKYDKWWIFLGCLAFPALVGVFYLMVFKPS